MPTKVMKEVTLYSVSFKNFIKKSFSLKNFFNKAKKVVANLGKMVKKFIVKASALAVVYIDKLVDLIHKKIDDFEMWLYIKLDEKFRKSFKQIKEVIEVIEEVIE